MMDMRVNGMLNAYDTFSAAKDAVKKEGQARTAKADSNLFSVSPEGKEYNAIRKAVANVPDVRETKVADIKARIENGTYNVSSADVARKILEGTVLFEA